jgi:hypothetical protein
MAVPMNDITENELDKEKKHKNRPIDTQNPKAAAAKGDDKKDFKDTVGSLVENIRKKNVLGALSDGFAIFGMVVSAVISALAPHNAQDLDKAQKQEQGMNVKSRQNDKNVPEANKIVEADKRLDATKVADRMRENMKDTTVHSATVAPKSTPSVNQNISSGQSR